MADTESREELTVEHSKRTLVASAFERIQLLFHVLVRFSSPEESAVKSGIQWLELRGQKETLAKAKEYIKSLCNPELVIDVPFAEQFHSVLLDAKDDLEKTTSAVVGFPSHKSCSIQGGALAVTMAQSLIEDKLKSPQLTSQPIVIEPQLREFAVKLGYSDRVIDQAVQKLGTNVTQNTLLNELLKTTASLRYQISAGSSQPKPSPAPATSYPRREVVARGPSGTAPGMVRYDAAPEQVIRPPMHQNWDREPPAGPIPLYALRDAHPRGAQSLPRTGYEMPGDVVSRGTKRVFEAQRPPDIVARGAPASSATPLMQGHAPHYSNQVSPLYEANGEVAGSSNVSTSERIIDEQELLMYQQIVGAKKAATNTSSNLRPVVIDGSNVAMSHGRQEFYSCKGIQLCVDWFRQRGHKEITVFVPSWRKEASRPEKPITEQEILYNLEREGVLVFTPSRKVNGRRIVCYDDRFIIKLAAETDGVVVSNDNFRDLAKENSKWRETVEQRLLMYSFVGDLFMLPDDPLGRHGPNLNDFLRKGSPTHPRICPYLKKCTYGLKCRFYHPERDQDTINLKLEKLVAIFGESVSEAAMRKAISDNPVASVTELANNLCDTMGKY